MMGPDWSIHWPARLNVPYLEVDRNNPLFHIRETHDSCRQRFWSITGQENDVLFVNDKAELARDFHLPDRALRMM